MYQARGSCNDGTGDTDGVVRMGSRKADVALARPERSRGRTVFRPIPEQDNRMLRVAINTRVAPPWQVVSVFFDRNVKGK